MKKAFRIKGIYTPPGLEHLGPKSCTFTVKVPSKAWAFRFLEQQPGVNSFREDLVKEGFVSDNEPIFSFYFGWSWR